jgi:hypothetical protein
MPPTATSEELAQNEVRRDAVPDRAGGARRTLCAFMELLTPATSVAASCVVEVESPDAKK